MVSHGEDRNPVPPMDPVRLAMHQINEEVHELERVLSGAFIDRLLSFPILGYDETDRVSLAAIHDIALRLKAINDTNGHRISALNRSMRVSLWARAIAEILVKIDNARFVSDELLTRAAPFVHSFAFFIRQVGCMLQVASVLRHDAVDMFLALPAKYGDNIRIVKPLEVPPSWEEHGSNDLLHLTDLDLSQIEADPEALYNHIERIFQLCDRQKERMYEEYFKNFFARHGKSIFKALMDQYKPENDAESLTTRVAVSLLAFCPSSLPWLNKVDDIPRFLQHAIQSVKGYTDGHINISVPQTEEMTERFIETNKEITKLETMNGVFITFSGGHVHGEFGPRQTCIAKVIANMTNPDYGLFVMSDSRELFVKPAPLRAAEDKWKYRVLGRALGIAIRYDIVPAVRLTPAAVWMIMNHDKEMPIELVNRYLELEDPIFAKSIARTKYQDISWDTLPDGSEVTIERLNEYLDEKKREKVCRSISTQTKYITLGMSETMRTCVIESFSVDELSSLLIGPEHIDVDEFIKNTSFDRTITTEEQKWLNEILLSFAHEQLSSFLSFVSGSPRPPMNGMRSMTEGRKWMHVTRAANRSSSFLPVAHTCFVVMDIPEYQSKEQMQDKLLKGMQYATTLEIE